MRLKLLASMMLVPGLAFGQPHISKGADIKAAISRDNAVLTTSGVLNLTDSAGNAWMMQLTPVAAQGGGGTGGGSGATLLTLTAPGTVVASANGSTFSWANQAGATVSGGGPMVSGASPELQISQPALGTPTNQAALVTNMTGAAACYTVLMRTSDPGGYYNSGMILVGNGINTIFEDVFQNLGGSNLWPQTETNFQLAAATFITPTTFPQSNQLYPLAQNFYERTCYDGAGNYTQLASATGAAGSQSWQTIATATAATLGNPTAIGFYEDATASSAGAQTYLGVSHLVSWQPTAGFNPTAAATTIVQTFANNIIVSPYPSVADPTDSTAAPVGWPSSDVPNLQNKLRLVFGSGNASLSPNCSACLITQRAQEELHLEHNQLDGTAGYNVSGDGAKQSNPGAFNAVFKSFPAGDPHDTTPLLATGLSLQAYCSGLNGTVCQGQGNIAAGIVRPETAVLPGDLVEVCYQAPKGNASWGTNWLLGGQYPPAGTTPAFYNGAGSYPYTPTNYLETDDPDGFPPADSTTPVYSLVGGVTEINNAADIAIQGAPASAPYKVFAANSGGFTYAGNTLVEGTSIDRSAAVHCYTTEIVPTVYSDTARTQVTTPGHVVNYLDGVEYWDTDHNWNGGVVKDSTSTALSGNPVAAAAIMVALQYGPTFDPNSVAAMPPASVAADSMLVRSISVWHRTAGTHVAPTLSNNAP